MGFQFIMSNRLTVDSNDIRSCFAWAEDGLALGIGKDVQAHGLMSVPTKVTQHRSTTA